VADTAQFIRKHTRKHMHKFLLQRNSWVECRPCAKGRTFSLIYRPIGLFVVLLYSIDGVIGLGFGFRVMSRFYG